MSSSLLRLRLAAVLALSLSPAIALGQGTGTTHVGDVFGDLVHVKRDIQTGQPILQKRWVALPNDAFGWAFCPIPVDAFGLEIPFLELSCDVDPAHEARLVPVDYFGRLSGGRTRESNLRMHFDEAIRGIKSAERLVTDETGRIALGSHCTDGGSCAAWKTIDSPFENLGIYHRLMKYGHLQTDPAEIDQSAHGDPEAGTVYHPALSSADWAKFVGATTTLLPRASASQCFSGASFTIACAAPTSLTGPDFSVAASLFAGAADKTGRVTVDLVQYMNRIISITKATTLSAATLNTLPALIRDDAGVIVPAEDGLPAPADERFVDFAAVSYARSDRFAAAVTALVDQGAGLWQATSGVSFLDFLRYINGATATGSHAAGFVLNLRDALRTVEFVHNYEVPADLRAAGAATVVTVSAASVPVSPTMQMVLLMATITNGAAVNGGTVTFTVQTPLGSLVGVPVTSAAVVNGEAVGAYVLPANTVPQVLVVTAAYAGAAGFAPALGSSTLTVTLTSACAASIQPTSVEAPAGGGSATVTVSLAPTCTWNASADVAWLLVSTTGGTGPTAVEYVVERNASGVTRTGHVVVANQMLTVTQPSLSVVASDFNADGSADLLWQHLDGSLAVWFMNGVTPISGLALTPNGVSDVDWRVVSVADFNHDGSPDLVFHHRRTGGVTIWFMQGTTATSGATVATVTDTQLRLASVADLNLDGWPDLVWQHQSDGHLVIWSMNQTQMTATTVIPAPADGALWELMETADMDRNGSVDLLWGHRTNASLLVSLMNGTTVTATEPLQPATVSDPNWKMVGACDVNHDGAIDLLWRHQLTGETVLWWMNGLSMTSWVAVQPHVDPSWGIVALR